MDAPVCWICAKHREGDRAQGGVIFEDDLLYVGHIHSLDGVRAYRGYLMVEPKRHVAGIGQLTDVEAARMGTVMNRAAAALRDRAVAEHVYAFVFGDTVSHLHVHLVPRYVGTPADYWGVRLRAWPDAPTVNEPEMRALGALLSDSFLREH